MSEAIIKTMYLSDDDLEDLVGGRFIVELSHKAGNREAPHPVLVIHAPEMPGFRKGDRVRLLLMGKIGVVTGPPAWDGEDWWVPVRRGQSSLTDWQRPSTLTLVDPTKPEPPEPASDPRATLVDALSDWRDAGGSTSHVVAALDDYISRALGRER